MVPRLALIATVLVAAFPTRGGPVTATTPPISLAACRVGNARPAAAATSAQPVLRNVAAVKHYPKQNLTFNANGTADGAVQVDARGGEFGFRQKVFQNGHFTVDLEATGDKVTLDQTDEGVVVTRGGKTITLTAQATEEDMSAVSRLLADSRAVRQIREKGAAFEADEEDSMAAASLLFADALVGTLTGDVGAPHRVARLLSKKARAGLRTIQGRPNTCYYQWEQSVLWAFMDEEECEFVYRYPSLMCSTRWLMQAESAWFSFITCSGLARF